jgi:hypothetical protein
MVDANISDVALLSVAAQLRWMSDPSSGRTDAEVMGLFKTAFVQQYCLYVVDQTCSVF